MTELAVTRGFFWHIHHDKLLEWSSNIEERIEYIKKNKPANEQELRLRLLKPVVGKLPKEVVVAEAAYYEAEVAYDKAVVAWDKAWAAYDKAKAAYRAEIEALHARECPNCPWNGKTIFLRRKP